MDNTQFIHNIETAELLKSFKKSNITRIISKTGFQENIDYIVFSDPHIGKKGGGQNKKTYLLTQFCYDQIVTSILLRKRKIDELKHNNIKCVKRFMPKEIEILSFVQMCLHGIFEIKMQYYVLNYRIDMYIVDKRIAIECDEHDHKYRDTNLEKKRQIELKTHLNCRFYRFNPDSPDFELYTVVNDILKMCL
jgi:very-short-patch-repair endonuclease